MVLRPTRHKIGHFGDVPQASFVAWYGKKLKLTQQKHAFTNKHKCTATQSKHKKTTARFIGLLRHLAWKRRGPILVSALHKFVTYLLTYTFPLAYIPGIHIWQVNRDVGLLNRSATTAVWMCIYNATIYGCPAYSRYRHYIFVLFLSSSSFLPRLVTAVADWMSTILRHMTWS